MFRKVILFLVVTVGILLLIGTISALLYKDQIIDHVVAEINKKLQVKVEVEHIDLAWLEDFPNLSLALHEVRVAESLSNPGEMASFKQVFVSFSLWDIIQKNYNIQRLILANGKVNLKKLSDNQINYQVFKPDPSQSQSSTDYTLQSIQLENVTINYHNKPRQITLTVLYEKIKARIDFINDYYDIRLEGDLRVDALSVKSATYFKEKKLTIDGSLIYDTQKRALTVEPTLLVINNGTFDLAGTFLETGLINLKLDARNADLATLAGLFDAKLQEKLSRYQAAGEIQFNLTLQGSFDGGSLPSLEIGFGIANGTIYYPEQEVKLTSAQLQGSYKHTDISNPENAVLKFTKLEGTLGDKPLSGHFLISNFKNPYLDFDLTGSSELSKLVRFLGISKILESSGVIDFAVSFKGELDEIRAGKSGNLDTNGEITMHDVSVLYEKSLPVTSLTGHLLFNGKDVALNDVSGFWGSSDFRMNGFFKNIIPYLFSGDQTLGVEATVASNYINLDELLASEAEDKKEDYTFRLSPYLFLAINCNIQSLKFRRLNARTVSGQMLMKKQHISLRNITGEAMGGNLAISGVINASDENNILANTQTRLNQINIDSVFYVFENFYQDWLVDRHLKGKVTADWIAHMAFDQSLNFYPDVFTSDITFTIEGGELNNFEPMQQLANYVPGQDLSYLQFSDLKNDIHIENKTIYLPEMQVRSNITNIDISGTHTFKQEINYSVVVPLRVRPKFDKDEYYGAIETDLEGRSKLFLKITGTTKDYIITYDTKSVKQKILADLKKEIAELKQAFKNKGLLKKDTLGLNEEEYFDWEDH